MFHSFNKTDNWWRSLTVVIYIHISEMDRLLQLGVFHVLV